MKLPLLALLTWTAATAALAAPPPPGDEAALRALGAAADAAWDAKDAAGMSIHYAADASLFVAGATQPLQGREAIRGYFARAFARRAGELRHVSEFQDLDLVAPTLALTDLIVRVEARQPDGRWATVRRFHNVSVAARGPDGWKLRAVRAYPIG